MNKGIFITATDTGAGKTYVCCAIAEALKREKIETGVFKPFATGERADAKELIKAAGIKEKPETVTPVFFKKPMSPYGASLLEKKEFSLKAVNSRFKYFLNKYEFTVVEGVGGLLVPLKKDFYVCDLIKSFSLPVIIVAKTGLGTINHILLTFDKLKRENAKIAGIIFSGKKDKRDISVKTNAEIVKKLTRLPVLELGYNEKIEIKKNKWILG